MIIIGRKAYEREIHSNIEENRSINGYTLV